MFLTDPMVYDASILSVGGKVAFKKLMTVGNPILHFLRSGRESNGDKLEKLNALAFHMNRATTHKINCVRLTRTPVPVLDAGGGMW